MPSTNPSLRQVLSRYRLAALVFSFLDTLLNLVLAFHILALWYWAESSEWEWLADKWRALGVWVLFSSYFSAAAAISAVGLAGVIKNKASFVRFYRDFYIADLVLSASFYIAVVYTAFQTPARTGICKEFTRHHNLVRNVQGIGINVEGCEFWLSRVALGITAFLFAVVIIRLRILFAISSYYRTLSRCSRSCISHYPSDRLISHSGHSGVTEIFLLPVSPEDAAATEDIEMALCAQAPMNELSHDVLSKAKETRLSGAVPTFSASQQGVARNHHDSRWHSRPSSTGINNNTSHKYPPVFLLAYYE